MSTPEAEDLKRMFVAAISYDAASVETIHSLAVANDGLLVAEACFSGGDRHMPTHSGSVSDFCRLRDNPPTEPQEMFTDADFDVGDVEARRSTIAANGYRLLGEFVLPAVCWWEDYYLALAGGCNVSLHRCV